MVIQETTKHGEIKRRTGKTSQHQVFAAPVAADPDLIVTVVNLANDTALTLAAQPDVPRVLTATIVDTTASIVKGWLRVVGVDASGQTVEELIDCSAGAGVYTSKNAYAEVTSVTPEGFSVLGGGGDETITVGIGSALGLSGPGKQFSIHLAQEDDARVTAPTADPDYGTFTPGNVPSGLIKFDVWYSYVRA